MDLSKSSKIYGLFTRLYGTAWSEISIIEKIEVKKTRSQVPNCISTSNEYYLKYFKFA